MRPKIQRYFVGDFETTVYENQEDTQVWASAVVEMYDEDVKIHHSINETFDYLVSLKSNIVIYYHNLKFDGSFWLSYLMVNLGFEQAIRKTGDNDYDVEWLRTKDMRNNTFKYVISDMGQWYSITIKVKGYTIEIRDSLKLLPFSVRKIGKSFGTKHKKLDMEYVGFRYAGCEITDEEKKYIANDVLVVKEALEIMFKEGHNKLTIGSCCLEEFKRTYDSRDYKSLFPDLQEITLNQERYGSATAGDYIRKSYKGGWCYLVKGREGKTAANGTTADVNSLYPSMMSSESGNRYPVGKPTFWHGNYLPLEAINPEVYYFVRIRTRFYLKENYLPCIQIKGSWLYNGTQWLESSDILNKKTGEYHTCYRDLNGEVQEARVTLTLTMTDFELIREHYDLVDFEILDGCYFDSMIGLFDDYIEKYKKIKMESEGALRELAKLFLNNLYGKMASSTNSSFKYAYIREDNSVGFVEVAEYNKQEGYIPIGSAITSYARNFTIRAAQLNFHGADKAGFIYADTDSIHCDIAPEEVQGITVDPVKFCCWKLEAQWDNAIFTRQKTYIEHVTHESDKQGNMKQVEPFYNVRCAGMPENCKEYFVYSLEGLTAQAFEEKYPNVWAKLSEENREFVTTPRTIEDFKVGLKINGKLLPKRIRGGIVLKETTYEMR